MPSVDYSLTANDYREVYTQYNMRRAIPVAFVLGGLFSLSEIFGGECDCGGPTLSEAISGLLVGYGVAALGFLAVYALNRSTAGKIHRGLERYAVEQRFGWDEEALSISSAFATARYPFALMDRVVETRNLLVAYVAPMVPIILPKRFLSAENINELRIRLQKDYSDQSSPMSS